MRYSTNKKGFTLVELMVVLGLSGVIVSSTVSLYGAYVESNHPEAIEFNKNIYTVAPSLGSTVEAFDFHQSFAESLESAEICLCLPAIKNSYNFASLLTSKPLLDGSAKSVQSLLSAQGGLKGFLETSTSDTDFTCVLLNRDVKKSAFAQLRKEIYSIQNTKYNLYSVGLYALDKKVKAFYRFAVKSSEDSYNFADNIKRCFEGEPDSNPQSREVFDIVVFPDPYLASGNGLFDAHALSRFTYLTHGL